MEGDSAVKPLDENKKSYAGIPEAVFVVSSIKFHLYFIRHVLLFCHIFRYL